MSSGGWRSALVLGGIASGRSEYAASLLAGAPSVQRVTADKGASLGTLADALGGAGPGDAVLVDGLEDFLPARGGAAPAAADVAALTEAVQRCPARLVISTAEVGMATASAAATSRAAALGTVNRAVAGAVDMVALVVAGQPTWLKGGMPGTAAPAAAVMTEVAAHHPQTTDLSDLRALPQPDERAQQAAVARAAAAGLGELAEVVGFAAATQGTAEPTGWRSVRVLALHSDHAGAAAAGAADSAARAVALRDGAGPLARMAAGAGARVQLVSAAGAGALEDGPAAADEAVDEAIAHGWQLAERAADEGVEALVLASIGAGTDTAAAAVVAALGGSATEPALLLGRVRGADGRYDDLAWTARCAAARDAVRRAKTRSRTSGRAVLAELGGPGIATATGIILGAAARRTPVLWDGPVGAAAVLVARGLASAARRWCLVPDHGRHPTVTRACEVLNQQPVLDLGLDLGEGAAAVAALPLLQSALATATVTATAPAGPPGPAPDQA